MSTVVTGPAKFDSTASYIGEDGRYVHTIRQSGLSSYIKLCAELERKKLYGEVQDRTNSSAAIGTAVHAGIEHAITLRQEGEVAPLGEMFDVAWDTYSVIAAEETFVEHHTEEEARKLTWEALGKWQEQVSHRLRPALQEWTFKGVKLYEDDKRVILMNGTIDYLDQGFGAVDWKTSSRPWQRWEEQRWNVQSSVYLLALLDGGFLKPADVYTFNFCVMIHGKPEVQWVEVTRTEAHFEWLRRQALQYALTVEADLPVWPLGDTSFICSPRWCPAWTSCRGAIMGPEPW